MGARWLRRTASVTHAHGDRRRSCRVPAHAANCVPPPSAIRGSRLRLRRQAAACRRRRPRPRSPRYRAAGPSDPVAPARRRHRAHAGHRRQGARPMWNAPIKTLKGQPTTLAAYKGKALMLVNVASQVREHAAVRDARGAAEEVRGEGLHRHRLPVQPVRRPGARHGRGDRRRSARRTTASRSR